MKRTIVLILVPMLSGNIRDGRYLFGYYSPYEDNKNIIDMLKDFVSREGTTEIDILGQP